MKAIENDILFQVVEGIVSLSYSVLFILRINQVFNFSFIRQYFKILRSTENEFFY